MLVEPIFTYPQILIGIIVLFAAIRIVADIIENHIESDEEPAKLSLSQRAIRNYKEAK